MRHPVALFAALALVTPVLADTPGEQASAKPKTKRICHADSSENPLFPRMTCKTVAVAAPAERPAEVAAPTAPAPTQLASGPDTPPR